jgi:nitrogen fixation protein FixH
MNTLDKDTKTPAWKSPFVIGWALILVVVVSVNAFMISNAFYNFSGFVVDDPYESGQRLNETMAKRKAVAELGWQVELTDPVQLKEGQPAVFRLVAKDAQGVALTADKVDFLAFRPSNSKLDFQQVFTPVESGAYQAQVVFPLKGVWDVMVVVHQGDYEYEIGRRIFVNE